ncbi:glycosyltransferase family 32 protein [Pseudosulfitobacter pseudonitzschiae]|uniref:glycosyltransferase family 32 protein n=1 Tax=Pseudosulfitobacter pseudonitzschiae TaxID=1402135 RepID=UPI001780D0B1|nr:glycosyltransferase [Pseudosulfitobacter pseudonitzschiae]
MARRNRRWTFLAASADPLSARVLRMRLHILLESNRLDEADTLITQAGDIGAALLNPFQMMRLKLGRGEIEAADALARVVSSGMGRGGGANSKFRATHIGALLNEAQLFLRSNDGLAPDMSEALERVFFHPAKLALDRWQSTVSRDATPSAASDIPRRILQYWDAATIPPEVAAVMQSWQDLPGYTYHRYDKPAAIAFLKDRFDADHVRAFRMANNVAEECDFLRLCLLLADGGIYTDADDMLVGDLDALRTLGARHGAVPRACDRFDRQQPDDGARRSSAVADCRGYGAHVPAGARERQHLGQDRPRADLTRDSGLYRADARR